MFNTIRRRGLFILTNIAIIVMINIIFWILETYFGVHISGNGYTGLLIFAAIFGFAGAFVNLLLSKRMAKKFYKLHIIDQQTAYTDDKLRIVYDTVLQIAQGEDITLPEIGYYQSDVPNAFATGANKNKALVAVSTGLLQSMTVNEIAAVVGHEMTHIINGDMVTMTLLSGVLNTFVIFFARVIAQAISITMRNEGRQLGGLAYYVIVFVLDIALSLIASMILMWYSRRREFRADAGSAHYVGTEHMIAALHRLGEFNTTKTKQDSFSMMKISGGKTRMKIFSSHPSIEKRIEALQTLQYSS